jgi:hypothetical protein
MKLYTEKSLSSFEPWSGAKDTFKFLEDHDLLDDLEAILENAYPDGMDETALNDLLWFEPETVYDWLGVEVDEDGQPIEESEEDEDETEEDE